MVIAISDSLLSDYQGARNVMGGLLTPPSDYRSFSAPLSNKGNPTSKINTTDNTFAVPSNTPVRLVDSSTGKVVYEGVGFDATQQAIAAAQGLTDSKGKKAAWQIQIAPGAGTTWSTVAQEKKNKSVLGKIADVALPVVGGILGGPLGAAAGSAASSVAQGRSLENTLLRAGLTAATTGLARGIGGVPAGASDAAISANVGNAINAAYQAAQQGAASSLGSIYGSALGSAALGSGAGSALGSAASTAAGAFPDEILVTGIRNAAPNLASSAIAGIAPGILDTIFQNYQSYTPPSSQATTPQNNFGDEIVVTAQTQPPLNIGGVLGSIAPSSIPSPTSPTVTSGDEIVVTAKQQPELNLGGTIGAIAPAVIPSPTGPTITDGGEIVVTAKDNQFLLPGVGAALATGIGATAIPGAGTPSTPTTPGKSGVLGTGLSATELATLGSLGISGLGSLFGSGGKGGTTTPYVSPFGAGPAIGGADFRVNPNITDYEQYGFGPEATFFRPEYNRLVASGAGMGGAPIGRTTTTTTPIYTPLIGGGRSGTTGTTGATGATTVTTPTVTTPTVTTPTATQVRPEGYTGVMPGQKIGDTQVVDGKIYVWGGFDKGWQWLATDNNGKQVLMPGNGATNVSSIADAFKSGVYRNMTVEEQAANDAIFQRIEDAKNAPTAAAAKAILPGVYFDIDAATAAAIGRPDLIGTQMSSRDLRLAKQAADAAASAAAPMFTQVAPAPTKVVNEPKYQTSQGIDANQALANRLLNQAANYVAPNGFTPPAGTVLHSPEWDKLYLDYTTGKSTVRPPRLVGWTGDELQRRLDAQIERGAENAQQTVDYWAAVRGDPRYAAAAQYEMTTGESAGGGPYLPAGYAAVGNSVMKIGTPQYEEAIRGLI